MSVSDVFNTYIVHFQGIVVDIDNSVILVEEGDECKILSGSMQKVWRRSIALANKAAASMDYVHSVYLSDAYLQVFILCFKDYKKYIVDGNFQVRRFIWLKDNFFTYCYISEGRVYKKWKNEGHSEISENVYGNLHVPSIFGLRPAES